MASVPAIDRAPSTVPTQPTYDAIGEAAAYLADGWREREKRRARIARAGPLHWDLTAATQGRVDVQGSGRELSMEVVVVERHPRHLRVVFETDGVRLTAYSPTQEFHELVVQQSTLLNAGGELFANGCGVTLGAGTVVTASPPVLGFRRVVYRSEDVVARGFLPREVVDRVYLAPMVPARQPVDDCRLQGPVTLRDAPSGKPVAELSQDVRWTCRTNGPVQGGARKVAVSDAGNTIIGYAPTAAVTLVQGLGLSGYGSGGGAGWGMSHVRLLYLWPGDALLARAGRAEVARVVQRALKVQLMPAVHDSREVVRLPLGPWRWTSFELAAGTRALAEKKHNAWLARVRYDGLPIAGGGAAAHKRLKWARSGLSSCFDTSLERTPGASYAFLIELDASQAGPTLKAKGPSEPLLERCIATSLRGAQRLLKAGQARFTLALTPSDLVD